ncbi:XdhC family protein [Pantoea sp. GM01]|uniref:XdhC family protein n=1 Tax=Pantoea sp. GM01 TaxID=1144320 RepID=UPI000270F09B|nr:XdhC family protein [Pantoea sp. GM01]EJL93172.1 xanthine and CO dehydrogenases maturation factor, XdhC/CoxF family [Pantoea sp. GM01]
MITLDQRVITAALDWCQSGQVVWICTVLRTYGSSPRAKGTIMSVNIEGQYCGSLSGGCIEEDFLAQLSKGDYRESSQIVRYGEGGMRPDVQLPCGGSLDILIEYLPADAKSFALLQAMQQALTGKTPLVKTVEPGKSASWHQISSDEKLPQLKYDNESVVLPVGAVPELFVAGYSTVAYECIRIGQLLGYHVRVCEHRPEMLSELEGYFSGEDNISIVPQHPARWLELNGAHASVAIVSLTHDPRIDELTMMEAVNTSAFYIGIMGSSKNSQKRKLRLQNFGGMQPHELARIKAPIGLSIGSKTPAEIALSVMADVVKTRNSA